MDNKGQVTMEFIITVLLVLGVFVFGLFLSQERGAMNLVSTQKWSSQETAYRIARNINNAYLLDDNSYVSDTIVWNDAGDGVSFGEKSVQAFTGVSSAFAPLPTSNIDWRVSDLNGLIFFKKVGGKVVVDYS